MTQHKQGDTVVDAKQAGRYGIVESDRHIKLLSAVTLSSCKNSISMQIFKKRWWMHICAFYIPCHVQLENVTHNYGARNVGYWLVAAEVHSSTDLAYSNMRVAASLVNSFDSLCPCIVILSSKPHQVRWNDKIPVPLNLHVNYILLNVYLTSTTTHVILQPPRQNCYRYPRLFHLLNSLNSWRTNHKLRTDRDLLWSVLLYVCGRHFEFALTVTLLVATFKHFLNVTACIKNQTV